MCSSSARRSPTINKGQTLVRTCERDDSTTPDSNPPLLRFLDRRRRADQQSRWTWPLHSESGDLADLVSAGSCPDTANCHGFLLKNSGCASWITPEGRARAIESCWPWHTMLVCGRRALFTRNPGYRSFCSTDKDSCGDNQKPRRADCSLFAGNGHAFGFVPAAAQKLESKSRPFVSFGISTQPSTSDLHLGPGQRLWKESPAAARSRSLQPRHMRHPCLTDLARAGWDIHEIATFAGHRSLQTTLLYIHLSGRDRLKKLEQGMAQLHAWRARMLGRAAGVKITKASICKSRKTDEWFFPNRHGGL